MPEARTNASLKIDSDTPVAAEARAGRVGANAANGVAGVGVGPVVELLDASEAGVAPDLAGALDVELERALEGLFRLGANRRFDQDQANAVGAVVTRAGYAALRSLHDRGPLSVRRLADACAMDAATASRQLQPLVEEGLVERRTVAGDARQVELALTPRGASVYARIVEYRLGQLTAVLEAWPASDRALLTTLVTRLSADLAGLPRRPRSPRPRRAPAGALC